MEPWVIVSLFVIIAVGILISAFRGESKELSDAAELGISPYDVARWGAPNEHLVCPHCQNKGKVLIKFVTQKKGISGAKATGAILTGGASLLATGLSRKEDATQAHCTFCNSTWHF